MLLCFLIKMCHLYPRFSVVSHGEKDKKKLCELPLQRYLHQRCVLHLCTQRCSRSTQIPHTVKHMAHISALQSSFCHLFFFFSYWPLSIQHPFNVPSFILERRSASKRQSRQKIYINRERKEEDHRENKLNWFKYCIQIIGITVIRKWFIMREGNANDGDDEDEKVQVILLALSRETLRFTTAPGFVNMQWGVQFSLICLHIYEEVP